MYIDCCWLLTYLVQSQAILYFFKMAICFTPEYATNTTTTYSLFILVGQVSQVVSPVSSYLKRLP